MPEKAVDFLVRRDDLRTRKFAAATVGGDTPLRDGQALLKIDCFAFTSNNVTYAAFGEAMSYWDFFPVVSNEPGWGRIPVWGFGEVVHSQHGAVKTGERYYGYYPMSTHLLVEPGRAAEAGFFDGVTHRKSLHAIYNQYLRTTADPLYDARTEDVQMLLRPLFITSFLIDDFLGDSKFFGARTVILSSASSKTAYGLAFLLSQRPEIEVIGLTSASNLAFVERIGCYRRALAYERIADLANHAPAVYVDMAGNGDVRGALHRHFGDQLKYSCAVGGTHWDHRAPSHTGSGPLPGAKPILFFAPSQARKRMEDWGPGGLQRRLAGAWQEILGTVTDPVQGWMRVIHGRGPDAVEQVYLDMLDGKARPDEGHILTLQP